MKVHVPHPVLDDPRALAVADAILLGQSMLSIERTEEWKALEITRRVADRMKKRPEVQAYIHEMREEAAIRVANRLLASASVAVKTLGELLDSKHTPTIRLRAANSILEHYHRGKAIEAARLANGEAVPEAVVEVVDQVLAQQPTDALEELASRLRRSVEARNSQTG